MVLVRRGLATVYSGGLPGPKEDDFWSVQILRCSGYNLAIISIYPHPDDRVRNGKTMFGVSQFVASYRGQYMILGDYNMPPDELVEAQWDVTAKSQFATPSDTLITCKAGQGSLIDYGLVSGPLKHDMVTNANHSVPISTHCAVGLGIAVEVRPAFGAVLAAQRLRAVRHPAAIGRRRPRAHRLAGEAGRALAARHAPLHAPLALAEAGAPRRDRRAARALDKF